MGPGQAIEQTYTCSSDFYFDLGVTHSPGGPGRLIECEKCRKCGHSAYPGHIDADSRGQ